MPATSSRARGRARRGITSRRLLAVSVLLGLSAISLAAQSSTAPGGYQGIREKLPISVAPQPVPFSHKQHVSAGMSCKDCHVDAGKRDRAGLPAAEQCMLCHATIRSESPSIRELARLHQAGKPLAWVRVYEVPDFVFFSHASHVRAEVECAACHGPIQQRDVLAKEVSTGMTACMDCHTQKKVSNECYLCHELGQ